MRMIMLAAMALLACGPTATAAPPAAPAPAHARDWRTVTDLELGFSIAFPGKPEFLRPVRGGGPGKPTVSTVAYDFTTADAFYGIEAVNVGPWSEQEAAARTAAAVDAVIGGNQLLGRRPIAVQGLVGEEAEVLEIVSGSQEKVRVRGLYGRGRFYLMIAIYRVGVPDSEATRFLDSFRVAD